MKRRITKLLSLSFSSLQSQIQNHHQPLSKSLPPTSSFSTFSNSERDSLILQQFKQRKLKGSSNSVLNSSFDDTNDEKMIQNGLKNGTMVVGGFKELGMSDELIEVMEEIGEFVPSEIQCVVIPTILDGKSLLLSSPSQHDRTLAYLLPLIQMLRRDRELLGSNSKYPRAVVLCASEEKVEQCFNAARYIIHNAEVKSAKNRASSDTEKSNSSIGLMIGTPYEILQYIEEGTIVPAELKYLVLDEADSMLGSSNIGPEINKIIRPLQHNESKSSVKRLQTIMAISTIAEVLGEDSPIVK